MPSAGFNSPGILFLSTWDAPERDYMLGVMRKLRQVGYTRVIEPCAGAFVMPSVHAVAGWPGRDIATSDVSLYTSAHGYALAGKDLSKLGVRIDGDLLELTGDSLTDGALVLFAQARARMAAKPDVAYWKEIERDMDERAEVHVELIRSTLEKQHARLDGMEYEVRDMWEHVRSVKDDPKTIVSMNPPTYKGGFEKFFDTRGRVTWDAEIEYEVFDAAVDQQRLAEEFQGADCLLLIQQQTEPGNCAGDVLHARHLARGEYVYVWTNKGPYVRKLTGQSAVGRPGGLVKLDARMIPYDYEIKADSTIAVAKITSAQSRYYKDLWMHRQDFKMAGNEFALYVDGYLAGMAGYDAGAIQRPYNDKRMDQLILTYAVGAPHVERLTRLVTMVAVNREVIDALVPPWVAVQADLLCTVERTNHPEIKGLRGIMKLDERVPDKTYGYRLIYVTEPVVGRGLEQTLVEWRDKETKWLKNRQKQAA